MSIFPRAQRDRWGPATVILGSLAAAATIALLVSLMTQSASADDAAHDHGAHDHSHHSSVLDYNGRFTGPGVWPPQHKGAIELGNVEITESVGNGQKIAARTSALANRRVQRALGADFDATSVATLFGKSAGDRNMKRGDSNEHRVTFFSYTNNQTVDVIVADGVVTGVDEIAADISQPPLSPAEMDRAAAIARDWWEASGNDRIDALEGFSIRGLQDDGSFHPVRMAYVSFHPDVNSLPELLTMVDLTNGEVESARLDR